MVERFCLLIQHVTKFCCVSVTSGTFWKVEKCQSYGLTLFFALQSYMLKNLGSVLEKARRQEDRSSAARAEEDPAQREGEDGEDEETWSVAETEMLLQFMAKIFIQMFPLYLGPKQVILRELAAVVN